MCPVRNRLEIERLPGVQERNLRTTPVGFLLDPVASPSSPGQVLID